MGRTFGLIIVSVGLWLVFSLPTRGPSTDQGAAGQLTSLSDGRMPSPGDGAGTPTSTAQSPDLGAPALRTSLSGASTRGGNHKAHDERAQAARSREIESEPEAVMPRPLDALATKPMPGTAAPSPPSLLPSSSSNLLAPPNTGTANRLVSVPAATAGEGAARPVSGGQLVAAGRSEPRSDMAVQTIPAAAPPAGTRVKIPGPGTPVGPTTAAIEKTAVSTRTASAAPVVPPLTKSLPATTTELTGATIKAPRIFDTVRRDLASPPPTRTEPQLADRFAVKSAQKSQVASARPPIATVPVKPPVSPVQAEAKKGKAPNAETKPKVAAVKPAKPKVTPPTVATEQVIAARPPARTQPVRVAQAYPPPSYVGRVPTRSTPTAMFVPSNGNARRAQFRVEPLWDSIRRTGM